MNARSWTPWIALAAVLALSPAHAATERVASPLGTTLIDTGRRLDINQINLLVRNDGTHGYDLVRGDAGLEYPRGSGKFALFAGGVWLSARVIAEGRNELRGALAQFGSEYGPGVMTGGTFTDPNDPDDRVYKVSGFTGNPMDTARVMRSPSELLADPNLDLVVHHSWSEYIAGAARYGAPVRTYRLPVTATPDPADSTDVQGPDFAGDQMLWCVYNDADPLRHAVPGGTTAPLGVEVQQTMSASAAIENAVFIHLKVINKGTNLLQGLMIGLWSDPDLGSSFDDYVGSDSARALVYTYNGHFQDLVYGASPPAIGYTLLRGPQGERSAYTLTGPLKPYDPVRIGETRDQMEGLDHDGLPKLDPEGNPSRYWYSGDAVHGLGWLDPTLADRRMMLTTAPLTLAPGDTQTVEAAIVIAQGADNLSSVAKLLCEVDRLRDTRPNPPDIVCPDQATESCPGNVAFWQEQCSRFSPDALTQIAQCVDERTTVFLLTPGMEADELCGILNSTASDPMTEAYRQYAAFLANVCAAKLGLVSVSTPEFLGLGPGIEMWSRTVGARSVGEMSAPSTATPCHCADSLLSAVTAFPQYDPARLEAYRVMTNELNALNNGFGVGPTCDQEDRTPPWLVDIHANQNGVEATWNMGSAGDILAAVYRLDGAAWTKLWETFPSADTVHFFDGAVNPGQTYRYRLGTNPDGREQDFAEAVVQTPPALTVPVALGVKPYPNPSSEGVRAMFLLPATGPAIAELFDLRGRLIERRSYPNLPPGETAVVLGNAGLEAGIYVVRLRQGGQSASAKAVIVR